ncbi:MAG: TylF/MycF/NovP-related O-methyltransferase [Planctomycetaceae bacterium]
MSVTDNYTEREQSFFESIDANWTNAGGSITDRLFSFTRFVPRQALATFLAREHIFQRVRNIHGHIIECGVFRGSGLFSWSHLSAIHEPYNHVRRIIGFDTFEGFPSVSEEDGSDELSYKRSGGLASHAAEEIQDAIGLHDLNRPLGHVARTELVIGDACHSIPEFIEENKHLVVALLYLDFDLYEPTKIAIESFWPRMPKGAVLAFDELNQKQWPGETMAVLDSIGIGQLRIERFEFNPQISFAVKE